MKKFLSLVLSLVMTMSLVTIGAGATEYKDLTDKSEIKYAEAVAVLNKVGVITGYEDGSFKPTNNLTRGAAAKIIVSLMIGPTAASNLTVNAAPYKDVPVTNTFAAYISYCKTAGYISGYSDGTFRPSDPLTGYAFSKMLLGALGYKSDAEGFTGSGWTMNVARISNVAGLLDSISGFSGNAAVTREVACQLALNTLKATNVEYTGDKITVSGSGTNVSVDGTQRYEVKNSSGSDYAGAASNTTQHATMQFVEEHFSDLKLKNAYDDFGRPSNQWVYKNVSIDKFAKTADFSFTASASGDTDADKVKDMGIKGYTVDADNYYINGKSFALTGTDVERLAAIAKLTANGAQVLLYVADDSANTISDVAVIQTQLMQINKVNSSSVTLKKVESDGHLTATVNAVEDDDATYKTLSGLKADDYVIVTPVATSSAGTSYDVASVAVPTTVTGSITKVKLNSSGNVNGVTVGGNDYGLSKNWSVEDGQANLGTSSVNSKQESTIYVDAYGYMIYAKKVSATSDYIIYSDTYASTVNNRIHYFANGYDMSGNPISLDMGTNQANATKTVGSVWKYTTASSSSNGDYEFVASNNNGEAAKVNSYVANGATTINGVANTFFDSSVKFLFLSMDANGISGVTVKDGVQPVGNATGPVNRDMYYVTKSTDAKSIKTVIVLSDADVEVSQNILYVSAVKGQTQDADGKKVSTNGTVYIDGSETTGVTFNKVVDKGFYTYTVDTNGVYVVNAYRPSVGRANYAINSTTLASNHIINDAFINQLGVNAPPLGMSGSEMLNAAKATIIDLDADGKSYDTLKDMRESKLTFTVAIQYNTSTTSNRGQVAYIYILDDNGSSTPAPGGKYSSVVDTNVSTSNGLSLLDMSSFNINGIYEITMNVVAGANLQTQIKEFLAYKGYTDIGNVTFDSKYKVTATTPDGIVVNLTMVSPTNTTTVNKVTVDGTVKYVLADKNLSHADVGVSAGIAKMVSGNTATPILAANIGSTLTVNGATYTSAAYVALTVPADVTTAAQVNATSGKYSYTTAKTSGEGVKDGNIWYLEKDAVLTFTATGDGNVVADLATASKTSDSITIAASGFTLKDTSDTANDGILKFTTDAAQTVTITVPGTLPSDATMTVTGSTNA